MDAHLVIVFAELASTSLIEACSGWPINRFGCSARRYRTIQISGQQLLTAEDPLWPPKIPCRLA